MLYSPLVVEHTETKKWLMKEKHINRTFEMMTKCNIALVDVGILSENSPIYFKKVG